MADTTVRTRSRSGATVAPRPKFFEEGEAAAALKQITKTHGEIITGGHIEPHFQHIPTGIFTLDMATHGGIPEGLVTLLYGWESSGKTTLTMKTLASAQRKYPNKGVAVIDIEGTFDRNWARQNGVDTDAMLYSNPISGEQALDVADALSRAENVSCLVVDSLAALIPTKELAKSFEDAVVGEQARLIGRFVRKLQQAFLDERKRGHKPAIMLINQWRYKVGITHGDPRTLPGGMPQHYVAGLKIDIKNKEQKGRDARDIEIMGHNEHSFTIAKNKIGNGIREGEFKMIRDPSHPYGPGFIDDAKTVVSWAKKIGLVTGGGQSWRLDGLDEKFRVLDEIVEYFYSDLDFFEATKMRLITLNRAAMNVPAENWYTPTNPDLVAY